MNDSIAPVATTIPAKEASGPALTTADREGLRKQLILHEGIRLKPYHDTTGHLTIGVGRNLTGNGITLGEALVMLDHDIDEAIAGVCKRLPWFDRLDGVRQRVLVDMAFNLGIGGLLDFVRFLRAMECGDYALAAEHMMDSEWSRQVGQRARRLAEMMRTGVAPI
jgi:lysozyme